MVQTVRRQAVCQVQLSNQQKSLRHSWLVFLASETPTHNNLDDAKNEFQESEVKDSDGIGKYLSDFSLHNPTRI